MRIEGYKPRKKNISKTMIVVAALVIIVALVWIALPNGKTNPESDKTASTPSGQNDTPIKGQIDQDSEKAGDAAQTPTAGTDKGEKKPGPAVVDNTASGKVYKSYTGNLWGAKFGPEGMTDELAREIGPSPITARKASKKSALKALEKGKAALKAKKYLTARSYINYAYISGKLNAEQAQQARKDLTMLADKTVLRRTTYVSKKDPFTLNHTFKSSDRLGSVRGKPGLVARLDLCVSAKKYSILVWINRLRSAAGFRAGDTYKMIKGPFHLVIHKSEFAADLYIQDLFVRRFPVAIGKEDTPTPEGFCYIKNCGRGEAWTNPDPESGHPTIRPGSSRYPMGPLGINIKLRGLDQLGTDLPSNGYALHGINARMAGSIGTAASNGCIRFRNKDIKFLYGCLRSRGTKGKRSWSKWSTVTIKK